MRLIDADALMAEMHNIILEDGEDRRTFYEVIERQPTIEPPRMRGRWIEPTEDNDYWECPVCHDTYELDVDVTPQDVGLFFCPNCGANMRGTE